MECKKRQYKQAAEHSRQRMTVTQWNCKQRQNEMWKRIAECRHSVGDVTFTHTHKAMSEHMLVDVCSRRHIFVCTVYVVVVVVNARRGIVYLQKHVRACLLENRFPVYFSLNRSNGIIPNAFRTFFVTIFLSTQNIFMNRFQRKKNLRAMMHLVLVTCIQFVYE